MGVEIVISYQILNPLFFSYEDAMTAFKTVHRCQIINTGSYNLTGLYHIVLLM